MKKNNFLLLLLIICSLTLLPSCIKEKSEWFDTSNGTININVPAYTLKNQMIKMEATGLNWPVDPPFIWTISLYSMDTIVGNPVFIRLPDTTGVYDIYAKALKDDFFDINGFGTTTILDTSAATNSLVGRSFGPDFYVDPRDQHKYHTTKIGNLEWFAENLAWDGVGKAYKNSEALKYFVGRIYTWDEATGGVSGSGLGNGPQGACPPGWTIPTKEDWEDFGTALNEGVPVEFFSTWKNLGEKISVDAYFIGRRMWEYSPDHMHKNQFNWNAIPAGFSISDNKIPKSNRDYGLWWSAEEINEDLACYRSIYSQLPDFNISYADKTDLRIQVRCVRKIQD